LEEIKGVKYVTFKIWFILLGIMLYDSATQVRVAVPQTVIGPQDKELVPECKSMHSFLLSKRKKGCE